MCHKLKYSDSSFPWSPDSMASDSVLLADSQISNASVLWEVLFASLFVFYRMRHSSGPVGHHLTWFKQVAICLIQQAFLGEATRGYSRIFHISTPLSLDVGLCPQACCPSCMMAAALSGIMFSWEGERDGQRCKELSCVFRDSLTSYSGSNNFSMDFWLYLIGRTVLPAGESRKLNTSSRITLLLQLKSRVSY